MFEPTPSLDRLLRSLDRRGKALRFAETAGIGLLGGAAVAIAVSALLWNEGRPSLAVSLAALGVGALCGLLWGLLRRPSTIAVAIRADRQLDTDDLFATAASLAHADPTDSFAAAVLRIAERRSGELSASAVVLRRFGARAWGGISLSAAAALTFALLTTSARRGDAASQLSAQPASNKTSPPRPLLVLAPESPLLPAAGGRNPGEDRNPLGTAGNDDAPGTRPATSPAVAATPQGEGNTNADPQTSGTGSGSAKTSVKSVAADTKPAGAAVETASNNGQPGTRPSGGVGGSGASTTDPTATATAGTPSGGTTGSAGVKTAIAPWQSERWTANAEAAREQLQSGRVPAAYRDLVRQYFDVK
ncbi:hypothetical protein [Humisphaera borealis]|uniref:Uncharacterized protein n=1 Tax=Humisphaera borealis TaxID=2807512 RepID=A0A7M2X2C1_9BACT|nr:hypothetical protein [Humisphaera borealis]QOV91572.1 hypothetical protein IPV69_09515 [Humisphaera borealis]